MGGFLGGLQEQLSSTFERKHKEDLDRKKKLQDFYMGAIINSPDEETAQHAQDEYNKLSSPEAKKGMAGAFPLIRHFGGLHRQQQAQNPTVPPQLPQQVPQHIPLTAADNQQGTAGPESQEPQQPFTIIDQARAFNAGPKSDSAPASPVQGKQLPAAMVAQNPIQQFNQGPVLTGMYPTQDQKRQRQVAVENAEDQRYETKGKALGLTGRDLALFVGSKGQRLPTQIRPIVGTKKPVKFKVGEEDLNLQQDSRTGQYFDLQNNPIELPDGAEPVSQTTAMRQVYFRYKDDPKDADPHMAWVNPKDPSKRLDASTLQPVPEDATAVNAADHAAKLRSQAYGKGSTFEQYRMSLEAQGYSKEEAEQYAGQLTEAYLNKRLQFMGAGREAQAVGAGGQPVAIPLHRIPTGSAPSIPPPAAAPMSGGAPAAAPIAAPISGMPAPVAAPIAKPAPQGARPAQVPAARPLGGMSPGQWNAAQRTVTPIAEAAVQAFADPTHPEIKGLSSFSTLASLPPPEQKRIANAVNIIMDGLETAAGHQSISGSVGPVNLSSGGFGQWAANAFGLQPKLVDQLNQFRADALKSLKTPEERQYLDALITNYSTIGGLRFASGAQASEMTANAIRKELPIVGSNVNSKADYADKMARIGFIITNASRGNDYLMRQQFPGVLERVNSEIAKQSVQDKPVSAPAIKRKPLSSFGK